MITKKHYKTIVILKAIVLYFTILVDGLGLMSVESTMENNTKAGILIIIVMLLFSTLSFFLFREDRTLNHYIPKYFR